HLEPRADATVAAQDLRFDQPFAAIVRDERDACRSLRRSQNRIEPVWLPAVIKGVEQSRRMAMQVHHVCLARRVLQPKHDRLSWRGGEQRASEATGRGSVSRIVQRKIELDR